MIANVPWKEQLSKIGKNSVLFKAFGIYQVMSGSFAKRTLREKTMFRSLGFVAVCLVVGSCFTLGWRRAGQVISMEEGGAIYGSDCGYVSADPSGGCNPTWGWGPKFWETCPQTGTLTGCMTYKVHSATYTCATSCGYHCGEYKSGYRPCVWGPPDATSVPPSE